MCAVCSKRGFRVSGFRREKNQERTETPYVTAWNPRGQFCDAPLFLTPDTRNLTPETLLG